MKKTIIVEFPDGFEFPEMADMDKACSKCYKCPLMVEDDRSEYCFVTNEHDAACPFFGGTDTATLTRDR